MKKRFFIPLTLGLVLSGAMSSCDDDDDDKSSKSTEEIIAEIDANDDLEYTSENSKNWNSYMTIIAKYLQSDATTLYNDWAVEYSSEGSYAEIFKAAGNNTTFQSALTATEQIIDGCADIAHEVGESKIGEPYNKWKSKEYKDAVYAVESWYSWHSRVDYSNNIKSIRNSYFGSRDGKVAENSISALVASVDSDLDTKVKNAISDATEAIEAIPQPFRSNIFASEVPVAMEACADLEDILSNQLKPVLSKFSEDQLDAVNENYVDNVVVPTYKALKEANDNLVTTVAAFVASPSNSGFESLADAWLKSREPWEMSEAFLFGPVADKGLDPNMDSWPLDQTSIRAILTSGDFSGLNWDGEYDEEDEGIGNAQSIRGFHTLEYLVYKNGKARTIAE